MNTVSVHLKHCYGINELNYTFDFTKKRTNIVYASNGVMKTSFAKTFEDISNSEEPQERVYRHTPEYDIRVDGKEIEPDEIFVIKSFADDYTPDKLSILISDDKLAKDYAAIIKSIEVQKTSLIKELKKLSGASNPEAEIQKTTSDYVDFLEWLSKNADEYLEEEELEPFISKIKYTELFNSQIEDFLNKEPVKSHIRDYCNKVDDLFESSDYFTKGVFNHGNISEIAKSLDKENFFKAKNTLRLGKNGISVDSSECLNGIIDDEYKKVCQNNDVKKIFNQITEQLQKNQSTRTLRSYMEKYPVSLINNLCSYGELRKKYWKYYFHQCHPQIQSLVEDYNSGKIQLKSIQAQAATESRAWQNVVEVFNERFISLPFRAGISNQDNVILHNAEPILTFQYKGRGETDEIKLDRDTLKDILSRGEEKALYLLHIIFDIEARIKEGKPILLIADDIADSFDYANKYAILEYIEDIAENGIFYSIILTHNFDFYRSLYTRIMEPGGNAKDHALTALEIKGKIELKKEEYVKNGFSRICKNINNTSDISLLASIPFVRNLVEYHGGTKDPNYLNLTNIIHYPLDEKTEVTINDYKLIYNNYKNTEQIENLGQIKSKMLIQEMFDNVANDICASKDSLPMALEEKLVLAMACRRTAEKYMLGIANKMKEQIDVAYDKQRTSYLLKKSRKHLDSNAQKTIDKVKLMTPELIHINAFMYEPILDLSIDHLISLYQEIRALPQ